MTKPGSQRNPTIESLKDRIARDPLSRAFLQLAEEYRKEGRYQDAIDVCLDGLQRHPTYHTARISLGRTYMECGDLENARRSFVEVLELQQENHLAAKLLAEIQKKLGDPAGAAATYRSILRYYPNDREVAALLDETLKQGSAPTTPAGSAATTLPANRPGPPAPAVQASVRPAIVPAVPSAPPPRGITGSPPVHGIRTTDPSPDFRPEDFGSVPPAPARDAWSAPAAGPPPPWSAPPPDSPGEPQGEDAMQTNTLAELYLRQGLVDRAIEVYRGMLRMDPGNQRAARRLNELAPAGGPAPLTGVPAPTESVRVARVAVTETYGSRSAPAPPNVAEAAAPPRTLPAVPVAPIRSDGDAHRDTIRRLERWLANVSGAAAKGAALR